jgi:hypothetical protein
MVQIDNGLQSNGQNNWGDVDQPGSREWREAGSIYIVIEDYFGSIYIGLSSVLQN